MRKSEVLAAESVACLNTALCHLKDIWEQIGIPEDQRLQRTAAVKSHVKNLLDMMIAEEESLKKRLETSIETCRKDLDVLCRELQLPSFEQEESVSMLQQEKDLRTQLGVLVMQKSQRMEQLRALRLQEQDLCDALCTDTFCMEHDAVPTLQQLKSYQQHLAHLAMEKERRHGEFVCIKNQIISKMEELDRLPDTSFEREVVCEDEEAFCLSDENIASLRRLLGQLEKQKADDELLCDVYRVRIREMWNLLRVSQEERDAFAHHMVTSKKTNMNALQAETKRLEELKLRKVRDVTESRRAELDLYWDRCFFSAEQRQAFRPYFDENFTEDLLQVHDTEVERLKRYYEEYRELFEGVQRWEESWKLFLELEKAASDPSRFTNRGGNLLKEEKQRAKLHKSLPKLEKKLKAWVEVWQQAQGEPFLVHGQQFLQHVEKQWELQRSEKEREKQERLRKKCRQREEEMLYGTAVQTPSKCRLPGANSPIKARKGVWTPGRAKAALAGGLEHNKENVCHLKRAEKPRASPQIHLSSTSAISNYTDFAQELSSKSNHKTEVLNSTAAHT